MEWYVTLSLMFGSLVAVMFTGLPVAFAFFGVTMVFAFGFIGGEMGLLHFVRTLPQGVQTFSLMSIPLFIFMGEIMFHTGVASRAIDAIDRLISRIPGRMSLVAITGGTVFASLSGSTIANTAMLSSTLLPDMYRRGYHPSIAIGPIVAVGGIAMLIPPSALAILLGSLAGISIAGLLLASIVPALILAALYFGYVIIRCTLQPEIAPNYDMPPMSLKERILPLFTHVLPLMVIFFVVVGSIFLGLATPTESAALGAVASTVAAFAYRRLTWKSFVVATRETLRLTVMTLFIIAGSITFSQLLAFSGATSGFSRLIVDSSLTPIMLVAGMLAVLLVLGCFMDQVSMMMITIPLFMPVVKVIGVDPVWFGVLMLLVLEISLATPPFGLLLFVAMGAAPAGTTMRQIVTSVLPFIGLSLLLVGLLLAVPDIALFLPDLMRD
jgi:tripartite ATP-independent transporter DctM subunit